MEVIRPQPLMDFDFDDARPMPFLSAPSTPKRFGDFESLTAPSSPSRMSDFYRYFEDFDHWEEEKPATPKSPTTANDFAFDFRSELEDTSLSAEELFDGGKIRPLKPPPRLQLFEERNPLLSPTSPRSPIARGKNMIREVFSPRKKKDSDPFHAAAENTIKRMDNERGRERGPALTSNTSRRSARSLSPYRVSEYPWEEEERINHESAKQSNSKAVELVKHVPNSSNKSWSRKWRLKDFLLFRSASEGRASDKDKYPSFFRKPEADTKNSSFRSTDSSSGSVSGRRKKGQVSAHELHYTTNKAASQDLKKRTFLPYKHGILGRLAFNPRE
ncbi:uncharacterized protein [Euphorbia lathyris]|uniref:uncharacterized protein n=1 Tax=Euphorbia lathyris TaxID=212925 RepID=UPI003313E5BC